MVQEERVINGIPIKLNGRTPEQVKRDREGGVHLKYEARIYNEVVRSYLDDGEENETIWSDEWAEPHYESVYALTPEDAIREIYYKFPERSGFVITDVVEHDVGE